MNIYNRRKRATDSEKQSARELRAKYGLSCNSIAQKLNRSAETIRQWTLDIVLTREQVNRLVENKRRFARGGM